MDKKISEYMSRIGKKGGAVKSEAKAEASRRNGRLGGKKVMSEAVNPFGEPIPEVLIEMARIGTKGAYSFWVYTEPLLNPSFHLKHKTDFEIVLQMKDLKVLEIKHNQSRYQFVKNKLPPKEILTLVHEFLSEKNSKDPTRTNQNAMDFAWKLLND